MARTPKKALPDTLRRAVERTFQSTVGSSALTRERAQELADDVLRGAEQRAARAGRGVREAGQRPRDAAAGVGERVREAIHDFGLMTGEELKQLRGDLDRLSRRVDRLERSTREQPAAKKRRTTTRTSGTKRTAQGRKQTTRSPGRSPRGSRG